MNRKEIRKVNGMIEDFFINVANEFNLDSGDVTPLQNERIDNFKETVIEYIEQNR